MSGRRTRLGLPGGIADHGGEIADEKNGRVPFILKVLELAQDDGVAEVQIGRGGIDAKLDAQRLARFSRALELRAQLLFTNDLRRALAQREPVARRRSEMRGEMCWRGGHRLFEPLPHLQ